MSLMRELELRAIDAHDAVWRRAWDIPPLIDIDEWAARHVTLEAHETSSPGRFDPTRFPFAIQWMKDLSPSSDVRRLVLMTSRQVSKTLIGKLLVGHAAHTDPCSIKIVQPTLAKAKSFSKLKLRPFIEQTPALRDRFHIGKDKDPDNTLLLMKFDGGFVSIGGANSSASLRGDSTRIVILDEVNEYPDDVDKQGDPIAIAEKCAANFPERKVLLLGNPSIKGHSKIEDEYLAGDQRHYFIPCPKCGHMAPLTWNGQLGFGPRDQAVPVCHWIRWETKGDGRSLARRARAAHIVCCSCSTRIAEGRKEWMCDPVRAEWRPTAEGDGETASYQMSALYSPLGFQSLATCVLEYYRWRRKPDGLRSWVNEVLGETFEGEVEEAKAGDLKSRLEEYLAQVPGGVGYLTAGVDCQGDRLIYVIIGWGAGEERWIIEWEELPGDPAKPQVWKDLDAALIHRKFKHVSGREMRVERIAIDSGGKKGNADAVYRYCAARFNSGAMAVKGGRVTGKPLVGLATVNNRYGCPLFVLCVDTGKMEMMKRLTQREVGAGYVHLPAWEDEERCEEFALQLTSERAIYTRAGRKWDTVYPRNHVWDCVIYARAALHIAGVAVIASLGDRAAKLLEAYNAKPEAPAPAPSPLLVPRLRKRWGGWRR